jgi:hypothetical protein
VDSPPVTTRPRSATSPDSTYAARSSGSAASHEDLNSAQTLNPKVSNDFESSPASTPRQATSSTSTMPPR